MVLNYYIPMDYRKHSHWRGYGLHCCGLSQGDCKSGDVAQRSGEVGMHRQGAILLRTLVPLAKNSTILLFPAPFDKRFSNSMMVDIVKHWFSLYYRERAEPLWFPKNLHISGYLSCRIMVQFGPACEVLGNQCLKQETQKGWLQQTLLYCFRAGNYSNNSSSESVLVESCVSAVHPLQVSAVKGRLALKSFLSFRHSKSLKPMTPLT